MLRDDLERRETQSSAIREANHLAVVQIKLVRLIRHDVNELLQRAPLLTGSLRIIGLGGIPEYCGWRGGPDDLNHARGQVINALACDLNDEVRAVRPREGFIFLARVALAYSAPFCDFRLEQVVMAVLIDADAFVQPVL